MTVRFIFKCFFSPDAIILNNTHQPAFVLKKFYFYQPIPFLFMPDAMAYTVLYVWLHDHRWYFGIVDIDLRVRFNQIIERMAKAHLLQLQVPCQVLYFIGNS